MHKYKLPFRKKLFRFFPLFMIRTTNQWFEKANTVWRLNVQSNSNFSFFWTDIDDCKQNPCHNGATCKDALADYICSCSLGYTGKNCSVGKKHITWNIVFLLKWAKNLNFSWVYAKIWNIEWPNILWCVCARNLMTAQRTHPKSEKVAVVIGCLQLLYVLWVMQEQAWV